MQFACDLTTQEARKSQDRGIRFGRKAGRCISPGPLLLHRGRVQDLQDAHLSEPKNKAGRSGGGKEAVGFMRLPWVIGPR